MSFLKEISEGFIVGDGAMGTMLHSLGRGRCTEALNITNPKQIQDIHRAYLVAGARLLQTNTYGANRHKLARYGLENKFSSINKEAVRLLKEVTEDNAYCFGTIGGIRSIQRNELSVQESIAQLVEQSELLLQSGVDGLLLETFYDFDEAYGLLQQLRTITSKPIIVNLSLHEIGKLQNGMDIYDAFLQLEEAGADVIGLNCSLGPYYMTQSFKNVPLLKRAFYSAVPNASLPTFQEGKYEYNSDGQYFKECAQDFLEQGVRLIGGCCGTTPTHIAVLVESLRGKEPISVKRITTPTPTVSVIPPSEHVHTLAEKAKTKRTLLVELDPPRKLTMNTFLQGAEALHRNGIDAITLADNSLANPRVSNTACATLLKQQFGMNSLLHLTCRDRNLIGLQSHLMGLHALGFHEILALTGDPSKVGDFPGATSVYDLSSFDLIELITSFNEGVSYSGKDLGTKTNFSIGAAFNPNVKYIEAAVKRLRKKEKLGANYFLTQPVYSIEKLIETYEATKDCDSPIFIGIMPLTSYRNALFLHHEVPGISLSPQVLQAMEKAKGNPEQEQLEGLRITKELLDTALELFNGIYFITPFLRYGMSIELLNYAKAHPKFEIERGIVYDK